MINIQYYWAKFLKKARGASLFKCSIHETSKVESGSQLINVVFDKHSYCGYDCEIYNCEIGSFCSISNNVIIGGGRHPMEWVSTSPVFYEGRDSVKAKFATHKKANSLRTVIGHDVWIGGNVMIRQGVNIGTGAIIGMGSIVTKDVAPYSIVAGSPASEIRKRFDEDIISTLLDIKWWEFDDEKLKYYAQFFNDPVKFIENYNK
jgi:acetyltransferase-like isoleucine patch superfamily enzyme